MALMAWADRVMYEGLPISYYLTAVPNGGKRNAREAGRLRRMGVKAGYPDYILDVMRPHPTIAGRMMGGLRLELKGPRGTPGYNPRPTDLQLEQISRLIISGYYATVAYGWLAAADEIARYLGIRSPVPCASRP